MGCFRLLLHVSAVEERRTAGKNGWYGAVQRRRLVKLDPALFLLRRSAMTGSINGRFKTAKGEGRYLVAVKWEDKNEVFSFSSPQDRQDFIDDVKRQYPSAEWATSEVVEE